MTERQNVVQVWFRDRSGEVMGATAEVMWDVDTSGRTVFIDSVELTVSIGEEVFVTEEEARASQTRL